MGDSAGGASEIVATGSFVGAGEFRPDMTEGLSLYVSPLTFVAKGAEPGDGPVPVDTIGSEVNDFPCTAGGKAIILIN